MNAECARPTCEEPARVLLAFDPRTARAWLRDLDNGDPSMGLLLCTDHAESTSVPVSWEIVDERRTVPEFSSQIYDSEPSFDDIFPPRAGYSSWDTIPYDEPSVAPRPETGPAPKRGDDPGRFVPRNEHEEAAYSDRLDRSQTATGVGPWYDTEPSAQPDWLERAESLDFGHDDYYDPYLDDPELSDLDFPTELSVSESSAHSTGGGAPGTHVAAPQAHEPEAATESGIDVEATKPETPSTVAPLVRPGSPNEQVRASELLAAAAIEPPQAIPPRATNASSAASAALREPVLRKDAVRLPERADLTRRDPSQAGKADKAIDPARGETSSPDLAASGTDGAPFPPHPGARTAND